MHQHKCRHARLLSLASKPPTMESPILASACPIVPSSLYRRVSSCAPNACFMKSRSLAVSREIIHGITVGEPSGIGGTTFGCGVIFMLLLQSIGIRILSSNRPEHHHQWREAGLTLDRNVIP